MDGGDGDGGMDQTIISRLMLKFRPIAPKPVSPGSAASGSETSKLIDLPAGRVKFQKRKYVRSRKNNARRSSAKRTGRKNEDGLSDKERGKKKEGVEEEEEEDVNVLRLMPEKAEEELTVGNGVLTSSAILGPSWERPQLPADLTIGFFGTPEESWNMQLLPVDSHGVFSSLASQSALYLSDQQQPEISSSHFGCRLLRRPPDWPVPVQDSGFSGPRMVAVVETVTVDCHAGIDPWELGVTDTEIINTLGLDTSPGFVSNSSNEVRWVNGAFRRMLTAVEGQISWPPLHPRGAAVVLEVKNELPGWCRAFSGRVKVKLRRECRGRYGDDDKLSVPETGCNKWQQVVPCDVWRMDGGGFAWRLDFKAALTLGRLG